MLRRRKLNVNDLYVGNPTSIYWYQAGFNWRAFAVFVASCWPLLRWSPLATPSCYPFPTNPGCPTAGLVATVNGFESHRYTGWIRLYNLTFLVGLAWSFALFWLVGYCFPARGLGQEAAFEGGSAPGADGLDHLGEEHAEGGLRSKEKARVGLSYL